MTLLQVLRISPMMSRQVTKRTVHFMRRDGDCQLTAFMLLTRYFLASDRVCCVCVVAESAFFAPQQRKSHTLRLTSAHFLSINAARENTKTGLCFAFITILYGGYIGYILASIIVWTSHTHGLITRSE